MARRRNEICVEWLESKDKGETNHFNVKHTIGNLRDIEKRSAVMVKFNSQRYQEKVVDLLDWNPSKQQRKKSSRAAKKAGSTTKSHNKSLFLAYGSPASSQATSISAVDPGESIDEAPRRPLSEKTNLQSASMSSRSANSFLQLLSAHHSPHSSPCQS